MLNELLAWLNGWRYDLDGWLVRARKVGDPSFKDETASCFGFTEEACIAVRDAHIARLVDRGGISHPKPSDAETGEGE
jgi:hypothetical protein